MTSPTMNTRRDMGKRPVIPKRSLRFAEITGATAPMMLPGRKRRA